MQRSQLLWHRLRANHLAERLPAGSFARAAYAGLQDSAPRAALVGLHARVRDAGPASWEDPSLVQTWGPRGAVFVVPRADLAVFALGFLPRDADAARALRQLAERARASVTEPRPKERDTDRLAPVPALLVKRMRRQPIGRLAYALAGIELRWDARGTQLLPGSPLELDEEAARRELARRFLRSLGPAGPARFARWAAVDEADARVTFDALAGELVEVGWPGGSGFVLAEDAERLTRAEPVSGPRLLAFGGDPVLQPGEDVVAADRSHQRAAQPPWASMGLALVDGGVAAAWGRARGWMTILPLAALDARRRDAIEAEALAMPGPESGWKVRWREAR